MEEKMMALEKNGTWELVMPALNTSNVGCKWLYTKKVNSDGFLTRLKAQLVAKGYTQVHGINYTGCMG